MRDYSKQAIFLLVLIIVSSCSGDKNKSALQIESAEFYELAIVDSIQIDLLTNGINILDIQDETGKILAVQASPPIAYIVDPEGKILTTLDNPSPNDPQGVGNYILSGEFFEDGVALMGQMRLKTYDMDFNLRKSLTPAYNQSGMIYMGFNHLFEFDGIKNKQLVAFFGGPQTELHSSKKEYYNEYNVVDVVDPYLLDEALSREENSKNLFEPIGELTPDSRYRLAEKAFYFMKPIFDVKDNELIYAFKDDTTLFKRMLPSGEISEQYTIPFDKFILFDGYSLGQEGFAQQNQARDRSGRIEKVFQLDGFEVVVYFSGLKMSELQEFDKDSPDLQAQLRKADFKKHLIIRGGQKVNHELELPNGILYLHMADNNGYLWASKNISDLEEEPEFLTFYKLKVVAQQAPN